MIIILFCIHKNSFKQIRGVLASSTSRKQSYGYFY